MPQLVMEGVALAPERPVADVDVERARAEVRHVAPPLPVVMQLLAQ